MSKTRDRKAPGRRRHSQISRHILMQYILSVLGLIAVFAVIFFSAWLVCRLFVWQPSDPLYRFLKAMEDTAMFWGGGLILLGIFILTYYYISKPLGYLDEIVDAASQLAAPDETPIHLSPAMETVQDELNVVREGALRAALYAKEAEQRKNDLIVYLAHDLKTPLTSVIGYLTLLRDEPDVSPAVRAKYTGIALEKALRLETLISEFFEITRFSLSQLTLHVEEVNLTRMLEQITFEFQPALAEKGLTWELQLSPDVLMPLDPDKMERVIDNLLRNAVNYCYPDSRITVRLETDDTNALITVENAGKTIPEDRLARIFEQFFRLDSSRSSSSGGAGLGLAIAKEIIDLHGGSIFAKSADERIAFTVTLPLTGQKV